MAPAAPTVEGNLSPELAAVIPMLATDQNVDAYAFGWPITVNGHYPQSGYFSKELIYKSALDTGYLVFFIAAEI